LCQHERVSHLQLQCASSIHDCIYFTLNSRYLTTELFGERATGVQQKCGVKRKILYARESKNTFVFLTEITPMARLKCEQQRPQQKLPSLFVVVYCEFDFIPIIFWGFIPGPQYRGLQPHMPYTKSEQVLELFHVAIIHFTSSLVSQLVGLL